ncbi:MAG: J domain-containing protein [Ilumatobacteraceae bacterium]
MTASHYDRLGVSPTATTEEIRLAYRELAWTHHPDRTGRTTSSEMMEINEAWRVLSDPMLRHSYDALLESAARSASSVGQSSRPTWDSGESGRRGSGFTSATPARFPWRFVLGFFVVAVAVILFLGVITDSAQPAPIDNVIRVGSCVDVDPVRGEAWEVTCDGPHDAQVAQLVPFDATCPSTTTAYRDRQGLGRVCVLES